MRTLLASLLSCAVVAAQPVPLRVVVGVEPAVFAAKQSWPGRLDGLFAATGVAVEVVKGPNGGGTASLGRDVGQTTASSAAKTRSGKIMRRILRKIAEGNTSELGEITTLAEPGVVAKIIEGLKG